MVVASTESDWWRAYNRDFNRFEPLSDAEYVDLVAGYAEAPVPLHVAGVDDDGAVSYGFKVTEATNLFVSASADGADPIFVHPLILRRENGRRYFLPLIRAAEPGRFITTTAQLGRFEKGEHVIALTQDSASSRPLPLSLRLRASRPVGDSLLARFMASNPVVRLKNRQNVLDDVPLMAFSKVHRREDRYKVVSFIIFSAENGGMMPVNLMSVFSRTVDVEWVMQQLFELDGTPIESRRRFQASRHRVQPFTGDHLFGNSPVLATATPNNNFADGRFRILRWSFPNPFEDVDDDAIYYSPRPVFLPSEQWSTELQRRYPELQQWSLFEMAMERCVNLNDPANPYIAAFQQDLAEIERHIRARYDDRGCRRLLQVPGT
jgi:hypothetical protein